MKETEKAPRCQYCGKVLRVYVKWDWPIASQGPTARRFAGWGGYGDNFFCGLRCGYRWAVHTLQAAKGGQ